MGCETLRNILSIYKQTIVRYGSRVVVSHTPRVGARLLVVLLGVAALVALLAGFVVSFVLKSPSAISGVSATSYDGVSIHLETVGAVGTAIENPQPNDPHPTWVGYLPTTTFKVPANSVVTITIDQEDSASGLRNPYWAQAQGIIGGQFHMDYFDAQGNPQSGDFTKLDDASTPAHSFAIPDLGVFVPLEGVSAAAPPNSINVITFSFRTGAAGIFHWQCFVPCGSGTIYGNGGPMQTLGYMGGFLVVQ
jgi:uncharacterized protein YaiE (UPF0345 family)